MYIKQLIYENVGPIENVNITANFTTEGNPKPILLVGENGSGKSTILSNIVDSFYEIASIEYSDACKTDGAGHQYYKAIIPQDIHNGKSYMISGIQFQDLDYEFTYLCKSGYISVDDVRSRLNGISMDGISWGDEHNYKGNNVKSEKVEEIFKKNVICYFGPDRYEKPNWLGDKYYEKVDADEHLSIKNNWKGKLENKIAVKDVTSTNLRWLMDVIADSRSDIFIKNDEIYTVHTDLNTLESFGAARKNLETIMSNILGCNIYFCFNTRNIGSSRFQIRSQESNSIISPSLDALSTGQIALFNTFATIIRYADNNDINKSINLDSIQGVVVIDEVELHLHTKMQKEVLPKLINLFPKVQFVITTHSPLFLLGMEEIFGIDGFDIYEMPTANKINVERFSEFKNAFRYFQDTKLYQVELENALKQASNGKKVLVVTEGSTDWKHMKAALTALKCNDNYASIFDGLDFEFFEFEPKNSNINAINKIEMGSSKLLSLCESYSKLPQTTRFIFIADRDDENINKKMSCDGCAFKYWGNNVFSFILPLPEYRKSTPKISIEHLYSDDEIRTKYTCPNGIERRLYLACEFDDCGFNNEERLVCLKQKKCGKNRIDIIEGSSDERVIRFGDKDHVNLALPKSQFASLILSGEAPFNNFNFKNFIPIFEIIKQIVEIE